MKREIAAAVVETTKAILATSVAEWAKVITEDQLSELASDVTAEAAGAVAREVAKASVGSIAGPVLKVLLRVSDQTTVRLEKLLREPLVTGLREATQALDLPLLAPGDSALITERLQHADAKLAQAYTLAEGTGESWRAKAYTSLMRGLIAMARNAPGVASAEFARVDSLLSPQIVFLLQKEADWSKQLDDIRESQRRGWSSNAEAVTRSLLSKAKAGRRDIEAMRDFAREQIANLPSAEV